MTMTVQERYARATDETRRIVDRLLEQDATDARWAAQLGPAYRQADVAALLGKSKQAVSRDRHLLALRTRGGAIVYPAFQFDGRRLLPGLGTVVTTLVPVAASPWTVASWLTSGSASLDGRRPLDVLREGEVAAVQRAADAFAAGLAG